MADWHADLAGRVAMMARETEAGSEARTGEEALIEYGQDQVCGPRRE
ncbi:MAG TPA: hypothetical protein VHC96_24245 [Puia sp.]|nr:hypothetical protein [Puia sp.]